MRYFIVASKRLKPHPSHVLACKRLRLTKQAILIYRYPEPCRKTHHSGASSPCDKLLADRLTRATPQMLLVSWLMAPIYWLRSSTEYSLQDPVPFSDGGLESTYFDQYGGEIVVEFTLLESRDYDAIVDVASTLLSDIWHLSAEKAVIRLAEAQLDDFQRLLPSPLPAATIISDIPRAVVTSFPLQKRPKNIYREFLSFQDTQDRTNHTIGLSWDGLPIGARLTENRNTLVVCGVQGREWASIAFCEQLIEEHPDISVIPVANPDGYIYSWETDRLWVKNRQPTGVPLCTGHDIANALFNTDVNSLPPCSDSWAGKGRQSPLEARAINELAAQFTNLIMVHGLSSSPRSEISVEGNWSVVKAPDFGVGYLLPKRLLGANYDAIGATLKKLL